jgi:hypothetical protein
MYNFLDPSHQDSIKEIFKQRPLSLLGANKLDHIIFIIREFALENILEIGTFAGGTAYLLAAKFPHTRVTTVDINNFPEYFKQYDQIKILHSLQAVYPEIPIDEHSVDLIQNVYKSLSPNAEFTTVDIQSINIFDYQAIIIDGDHTEQGLMSDLSYCYHGMKSGVVFVDDCVHPHIRACCEQFCIDNDASYEFAVYCDYGSIKGHDLCVIKKR